MPPIVLHHGFMGYGDVRLGPVTFKYFRALERAFAERGYPVVVTGVHPTAGIVRRATQLKERMLAGLHNLGPAARRERAVLIAHSMGGLDARYMIHSLGMAERVSALVTVCTPHRGTTYADWALRNLGLRLGGMRLMKFLGLDVQAVADLTTDACSEFNEAIPDVSGVRYFSVSAARPWWKIPPWALHAHKVIFDREGANDGLVSVRSATWGEHLATWPVDHWQSANRRLLPEGISPMPDVTPYYVGVLERVMGRMGMMEMQNDECRVQSAG